MRPLLTIHEAAAQLGVPKGSLKTRSGAARPPRPDGPRPPNRSRIPTGAYRAYAEKNRRSETLRTQ